MKINVTYSMELNEVPEDIRNKITNLQKESQHATDFFGIAIKDLEQQADINHVIKVIENIRGKLFNIDQKLLEYSLILVDYQSTSAQANLNTLVPNLNESSTPNNEELVIKQTNESELKDE